MAEQKKVKVSILRKVVKDIFTARTVDKARDLIRGCVTESKINNDDKQTMLDEIGKITTLNKMHQYIANAILAFEGDRVI